MNVYFAKIHPNTQPIKANMTDGLIKLEAEF